MSELDGETAAAQRERLNKLQGALTSVREALKAQRGGDIRATAPLCASLRVGAERLAPSESVEGVSLFQRRGKVRVEVAECDSTQQRAGEDAAGGDHLGTARDSMSSMQLALVPDAAAESG